MKKGDFFGDLALLYNAPRSASLYSLEDSYLWYIERLAFRSIIKNISKKNIESNRKLIENIKFFSNFFIVKNKIICFL